ncbi:MULTISPECIES: transposase family protein [unclassified Streptomyces]|uniref:transposase family protein n=1 Tax=unclassified Streptomyces TaxID=2593676 RepID=UPI003870275D
MASSVLCADLLDIVFSQLGPVEVGRVQRDGGVVRVTARTREGVPVSCSGCGVGSVRVHSRYQRRIKDCAVGGQPVVIPGFRRSDGGLGSVWSCDQSCDPRCRIQRRPAHNSSPAW